MNDIQNLTDRSIITQYKEGKSSVLPILVKRYHKVFCEKAYWITKDKEIARDTAQECWITIINKIDSLKNIDSFKSWAFRIVYTKSIDAVKRRNLENENLRSIGKTSFITQSPKIESNHIHAELLKAILELPKGKQDIIRLFYAEEYSILEISTFLKIPIGTVKSRLFKAREKLKSILKKVNYEK